MKDQKQSYPPLVEKIFLSWFGLGFLPKAPGTFGSLGTIPLLYLFGYYELSWWVIFALVIILTMLSIYITEGVQKKYHLHDPQWIVIDEVIGMIICWLFHPTKDTLNLLVVLVFFRFFDIVKIWPASYFDRLKHGAGTILDDVVSGLYAGICVYLFWHFF